MSDTLPKRRKRRTGKQGKPTVQLLEVRIQALEMRKAGNTYEQIAKALGYTNRGAAYKAVMAVLKDTAREPAEELRTLEVERLDAMIKGLWKKSTAGDPASVAMMVKLQDRRARLLGLDAPARQAQDVNVSGDLVFEWATENEE